METPIKKHISYSEMSDWVKCPHFHKKVHVEKVHKFKGNEYSTFGTAMHSVCENILLKKNPNLAEEFRTVFEEKLKTIPTDKEINDVLVKELYKAGPEILATVEESVKEYFGEYEVYSTEERLYEEIEGNGFFFKGFVDAVIKVGETYHLFDWKTCSWGWDAKRKSDKLTTYQLTLYKHYFCLKHNIDPKNVEIHFALLKRTAKKKRVEFFRVTSGKRKTENALKLLYQSLYNIVKGVSIKNRLRCYKPYSCDLRGTTHCPKWQDSTGTSHDRKNQDLHDK